MDIAAWLRGLGLEQYEPAFRANEIDERVLPSLTAEDLKDLGVSLVGHRRRLLEAIAALGTEASRPSLPIAPIGGIPLPTPPPLEGISANLMSVHIAFRVGAGAGAVARRDDEQCDPNEAAPA
jgi:hypothetical protein